MKFHPNFIDEIRQYWTITIKFKHSSIPIVDLRTFSHISLTTFGDFLQFSFSPCQFPTSRHTVRTQIQESNGVDFVNRLFYWNDRRHEVYFLQKSGSDQRGSEMISFSNDHHCTKVHIATSIEWIQEWIQKRNRTILFTSRFFHSIFHRKFIMVKCYYKEVIIIIYVCLKSSTWAHKNKKYAYRIMSMRKSF